MNENLNLVEILKNCPKGTEFYSTVLGCVTLEEFNDYNVYSIIVKCKNGSIENFTSDGKMIEHFDGECTLFPSKDQRDWSKFSVPWYKNEKFDPKTLKPFDRVLIKDGFSQCWYIGIFSHYIENDTYPYKCVGNDYKYCIPYNDDTKHLVGTTEEAPEYYRYWED